jgi:phosphohistidine phosphatase
MRMILFRHGPAGRRDAARWPDDADRPVTKRGLERTARAAAGLRHLLGRESLVLTSPLVRARQSADLVGEIAALDAPVEVLQTLAPGSAYRETLRRLAGLDSAASVVLVGHEPHLGRLAGLLLFGAPATNLALKKAGACVIDFVGPVGAGTGRLHAFLSPRLLRRLGRVKVRA